ncbi:hypothetical protein L6452_28831 [Arctium lappa]|uniref:Uncharacterized protein n=1 Tax=Arctium lappa TaxID=4217 RepID=A0ACB9A0L0_ARCLA|nr:hypothetical protein L6452_28831 [Arctium lappa]
MHVQKTGCVDGFGSPPVKMTTTTTLEKLFLQIFERKDWIIEQVQQQADAYTQQLASRLLIDGITPPPWLLNPNFKSISLNPNELEKEEIISRLLLQPSRDSVPYSSAGFSRYYRPVVAGGNGQLSTEMCMETHSRNQGRNVSNEPPTTLECRNNDTGRSLNCVTEQDDSVNSPQNETDARISSIYAAPDTSLARIQRSKSRQKARELRTNAKTAAKSCLSHENRTHISFSGESITKSDIHEITQDKCPSELDKCNHISGANSVAAEGEGDKGNVGTSYSGPARSGSSYEKPSCLNDHPKTSLSSEKEELDGSILVPPTGKSLEQSGLVNGAMEGINLPDVSLGSYAAKKSITGKTQDTQRQSKLYSGRLTRSRSSVQQTSGINNSPKLGKSSSCNPKEGRGALPISVGNLTHGLDASDELLDAVEASQMLSDRIGETQAIHSNEGVLKPVISSNIAALRDTRSTSGSIKEHLLGANHQENVEMVVGNVPMDEPVVMQPVNSGIKLDPVTLCAESGGLASRQSSECCMVVKPKQLNFDEMDECDLNGICSPLSKKRKLSGLSGQECYPSKESASSTDHKYSSTFFEQQSPMGMVLSSKSKVARTDPQNNIDECAKDDIMDICSNKNENPVVEEVEHNSTFCLQHDVNVSCEVDLGHKGEESAVYIPEPKNTSLFISSLTKQVNNNSEDCFDNDERIPEQDLGSIKSKEFEVGMNMKLSNLEFNSAKVGTWPWKLQREVEDQPNCFSDSQGFRVHIQRDVIHCDLEVPENDLRSIGESASVLSSEKLHVSHSNGIQSCDKEVDHGMMCDLLEGTESLHKLQAPEATITEVDDDTSEIPYTLEQFGPTHGLNLIENAADDSTYSMAVDVGAANPASNDEVAVADTMNTERSLPERVSCLGRDRLFSYGSFQCLRNDDKTAVGSDEIMSVYEGFIIDEQVENAGMENAEGEIDFDTLEIPNTTFARASILEQICKSASTQTPLSQFSSTFKQHQIQDLYGLVADGFLEHMDLGSTMSLEEDSEKHLRASDSHIPEVDSAFPKQQNFDLLPFSSTPFCWQSKNHYSSPVGKFWERSASSSGSSEKRLSSNPELTCFPIEEDPSSNEDSENAEESDELQESIISGVANDVERGPPIEPVEVRFQHPNSVSTEMKIARRENDEVAVEIEEGFVSRIKDELAEREAPLKSTEVCSQHVNPMSIDMKYSDRCSSYSANKEVSLKQKPKNHPGIRISRYEENRTSSIATRASSRGNVSLQTEYSKIKSSVRKGIPRLSQKEAKRNNIVSNITSFIPIVQQKQAAAVCPGKRDIKVKALEAAEAAKRREQEKENERKMKKEALKLERARMEKENAREMELNKKKKQEEQKKKEADIAARKRQREEDEKKQMAKKRKHVAEARKEQKLQYEKSRAGKVEMEKQHAKNAAIAGNKKGSDNATENLRQNRNADERSSQRNDTELRTDKNLVSFVQQVTTVLENFDASNGGKEKATSIVEKSPVKVGLVRLTSQENSYDISPYQCSDDEDEEEDEIPTKKFVPSWARCHL